MPGLDRARVDVELRGDLVEGEEAAGAEPFGVACEMVVAAEVEHDPGGEGLALAGAVAGGVELGGCPSIEVVNCGYWFRLVSRRRQSYLSRQESASAFTRPSGTP